MNIQDWFPLGLSGLISLLSKGLSYNPIHTHIYVFIGIEIESQQHFSTLCFYRMENTVWKKKKNTKNIGHDREMLNQKTNGSIEDSFFCLKSIF